MGKCDLCERNDVQMTYFRGLCVDCAETEFTRIKLLFEVGDTPVATMHDLDDFILGALFSKYGKTGLFGFNCWFVRSIVDALPEQYAGVNSGAMLLREGEFMVEIKQPIPADVFRDTINRYAEWPGSDSH